MIAPTWYPDDKQLRQFAVISLVGFGVLGLVARFRFGWQTTSIVFWVMGALTFLVGVARPRTVLPVYTALMLITLPIGWVLSSVLLRVLFYGFLTPIGLVSRLMGRDPLGRKRRRMTTHWLEHRQRMDTGSYYRQA